MRNIERSSVEKEVLCPETLNKRVPGLERSSVEKRVFGPRF